jgi:hypothetical protein
MWCLADIGDKLPSIRFPSRSLLFLDRLGRENFLRRLPRLFIKITLPGRHLDVFHWGRCPLRKARESITISCIQTLFKFSFVPRSAELPVTDS